MGWALLAVIIATLLGHVCVLPLHAHAAGATEDHHGRDSDATDQAPHIGSCEALASSPIVHPPAVVTSTVEWAALPFGAVMSAVTDRFAGPRPKSTPLFLLHASFLI
jgi:hypothetical protein